MLAIKVLAARRRDIDDIRFLVDKLKLGDAESVVALCSEIFPDEPLPARARLVLEDVFEPSDAERDSAFAATPPRAQARPEWPYGCGRWLVTGPDCSVDDSVIWEDPLELRIQLYIALKRIAVLEANIADLRASTVRKVHQPLLPALAASA